MAGEKGPQSGEDVVLSQRPAFGEGSIDDSGRRRFDVVEKTLEVRGRHSCEGPWGSNAGLVSAI